MQIEEEIEAIENYYACDGDCANCAEFLSCCEG